MTSQNAKQTPGRKSIDWPTSTMHDGIFHPPWATETTAKTVQLLKCSISITGHTKHYRRDKRKRDHKRYTMKRASFPIAYTLGMYPYELGRAYLPEARLLILADSESNDVFALDCQLFRNPNIAGEPCNPANPSQRTIVVSWTGPDDGVYPERDSRGEAQEITMDSCWDCLVDGRTCRKVGLILYGPKAGLYLPMEERRYRSINEIFGLEQRYSLFVEGARQHSPTKRKRTSSDEPTAEKKSKPMAPPPVHPSPPSKPASCSSTSSGQTQRSKHVHPQSLPLPALPKESLVGRGEVVNTFASSRSSAEGQGKEAAEVRSLMGEADSVFEARAGLRVNLVEKHHPSAPRTVKASNSIAADIVVNTPAPIASMSRSAGKLARSPTVSRSPTSPTADDAGMVLPISKTICKPADRILRGDGESSGGASAALITLIGSSDLQITGAVSETQTSQLCPTFVKASPSDIPTTAPPPDQTPVVTHEAAAHPAPQKLPQSGPPSAYVPSTSEKIQWHLHNMAKLCVERDVESEATSLLAETLEAENTDLATSLARVTREKDAQGRASDERERAARKAAEAEKLAREEAEAAIMGVKKELDKAKGERDEADSKGDAAVKDLKAKSDQALSERDQALRERDQAAKQRDQAVGERDRVAEERDAAAKIAKSRLMERLEAEESLREETTKSTQAEEALRERRRELIELKAELEELKSKMS